MKPADRPRSYLPARTESAGEDKHLWDYVRVVYKRRWIAIPAFLAVFATMTFNSLRETPVYRSGVQLLIEKDAPTVATLDQMFQSQEGWFNDEFYQTQHRILQSRSLAKRTIDAMELWEAPTLGQGPEPKAGISPVSMVWSVVDGTMGLARRALRPGAGAGARAARWSRPGWTRARRSPGASRSFSAV